MWAHAVEIRNTPLPKVVQCVGQKFPPEVTILRARHVGKGGVWMAGSYFSNMTFVGSGELKNGGPLL